MKTTMTLSLDKKLKTQIQYFAKRAGTTVSNIVNMYFAQIVTTGEMNIIIREGERVSLGLKKSVPFDTMKTLLDEK